MPLPWNGYLFYESLRYLFWRPVWASSVFGCARP